VRHREAGAHRLRASDVIVGVNKYKLKDEDNLDVDVIDNVAVRESQVAQLKRIRASRDNAAVDAALAALTAAAESGKGNLLDLSVKAMRLRATVGEVSDALERIWGRHRASTQAVSGVYQAIVADDEGWGVMKDEVSQFAEDQGRRPRILIAKLGQDGHDRGAKVIATAFADLGFDVDIAPLFQTPEEAARQAIENDVHAVGVSTLAAGHKTLVPQLIKALRAEGADDIVVVVGGVIPAQDYDELFGHGVPACSVRARRFRRRRRTRWTRSRRSWPDAGRRCRPVADRRRACRQSPCAGQDHHADRIDARGPSARAGEVLRTLLPHTGQSIRVGISGVPGVGKSTFIEALGLALIARATRWRCWPSTRRRR
jgi:methylmalonyl-CoA mutase cobalamin-binding domain/chain